MNREQLRKVVNALPDLKMAHLSPGNDDWWWIDCTNMDGEKYVICDHRYWDNYIRILDTLKKKAELHENKDKSG